MVLETWQLRLPCGGGHGEIRGRRGWAHSREEQREETGRGASQALSRRVPGENTASLRKPSCWGPVNAADVWAQGRDGQLVTAHH